MPSAVKRQTSVGVTVCEDRLSSLLLLLLLLLLLSPSSLSWTPFAEEYDEDRERKYRENRGFSAGEWSSNPSDLVSGKSLDHSSSSCIPFY